MRRRIAKAGEFRGDLGALAALVGELTGKRIDLRSLLLGAVLPVLGLFGVALRVQPAIVDFSNRLVDLKRHGLVLGKNFVALRGYVAQQREQFFARQFLMFNVDDCFGAEMVGQFRLHATL